VCPDLVQLLRRERTRLREDVLRDRELADVVQQRRGLHPLDLALRHVQRPSQRRRVELHAADVRLRRLVLCVDRERQRFNCGQVQIRGFLHTALLFLDASAVGLVAPVRQGEWREGEQHQPGR
jgi:hypothetical protein